MIVSGGTDRFAATAAPTTTTTVGNTTMMMANLQQQQQQQQQLQQPQQQLQQPQQPEDFWWWPTQNVDGIGLAQHQQISSSSSLQQQLQQQLDSGSGADEFDNFDLSMLINNATDGYFNDCRLSTAAISATVTVRTNAIDDSDYYAPTTTSARVSSAEATTPTQQQMDLQQLLSLCDDLCFFGPNAGNNPATGNDVKPTSIFDQEQQQAAAVVTTTTACNTGRQSKIVTGPATIATVPSTPTPTGATKDVSGDSTSNTTLLRSLLTATVPSIPAITVTHPRDSAVKVESTTEAVPTITTSTTKTTTDNNNKVSTALDNDKKINNNKHRILIEMLRGETNNNDVAVVPTRPTRRRPRSAAFGTDSDRGSNDDDDRGEPSYGGRRRLNGPSPLVDDGPDVQRMDMDDDGLIMYGSPYYSASTSPLWLDHMAAAAAAETTGASPTDFYPCATTTVHQQEVLNRSRDQRHIMADDDIDNIVDDCCAGSDYCNDYGSIGSGGVFDPDGGYYSVAATEVAYSPSTATEVEFSPSTVTQAQSVTSPLSSCGNSSTTTISGENGPVGMMERMCWKTAEGTATDDEYYTYSSLLTAMMEAEAVATSNDDAASDCCSGADTVGSSCISSSSSSSSSCSSNNITTISGNHISGNGDNNTISLIDDSTTDSDGSDTTLVQSQLQQLATCTASPAATVTAAVPPVSATTTSSTSSSQHIHLWQFLKELLMASTAAAEHTASVDDDGDAPPAQATSTTAEYSPSTVAAASANLTTANRQQQQQMIRWLDRQQGVFKIEDSQAVARLWGRRKNRPAMNYDKLSRSLRQYYKKGIMQKTERSQRLVYQFCHPYNA